MRHLPSRLVAGVAMRLNIDFCPRRTRCSARSIVLLTAAILTFAVAAWRCYVPFESAQTTRDRLRGERVKDAPERIVLSSAQADSINRAIRQLNLPWSELFSGIEAKLTDDVALLSLEPDATNHTLRLQGEAKSPQDMLDFIGSLEDPAFFESATLIRHEIVESDRNKPIRFIAEVQWRPE